MKAIFPTFEEIKKGLCVYDKSGAYKGLDDILLESYYQHRQHPLRERFHDIFHLFQERYIP